MSKKEIITWIGICIVVLFFIVFIVYEIGYAFSSGTENIIIKEKWVKYHDHDAKYLVSSNNDQVFQITDSIVRWRWNSSDLYASLDEGQTCQIKTQGWRFPLFSDYKNIIEADC